MTCDYLDHWAAEDIVFYILVTYYIVHFLHLIVHNVLFGVQHFFVAVFGHTSYSLDDPTQR